MMRNTAPARRLPPRASEVWPISVDVLVVPPCMQLDFALVVDTLRLANICAASEIIGISLLTATNGPVALTNGRSVEPDRHLQDAHRADMVIILNSCPATPDMARAVMPYLRRAVRRRARIVGITNGPMLMAHAGLLDNTDATAHWEVLPACREQFPRVNFVESLWVAQRNLVTCAGHLAIVDMLLSLLSAEFGDDLAAALAQELLLPNWRKDSTPQRNENNTKPFDKLDDRVSDVVHKMKENLEFPVPLPELAESCGASIRQLQRLFLAELGVSPSAYYVELRLEKARDLLFYSTLGIREVALSVGFLSSATFCRAIRQATGMTAGELRARHKDQNTRPKIEIRAAAPAAALPMDRARSGIGPQHRHAVQPGYATGG